MFKPGQRVAIYNLHVGGANGEGMVIKRSEERAFKGQWLIEIENGLTINIEPGRMIDAGKFEELMRMEYKIVEYLLHHKEGLKDLLRQAAITMKDVTPEFKDLQKEAVVDFLVDEITIRFYANRTDVEDLLTKELLEKHFGEYYFDL